MQQLPILSLQLVRTQFPSGRSGRSSNTAATEYLIALLGYTEECKYSVAAVLDDRPERPEGNPVRASAPWNLSRVFVVFSL